MSGALLVLQGYCIHVLLWHGMRVGVRDIISMVLGKTCRLQEFGSCGEGTSRQGRKKAVTSKEDTDWTSMCVQVCLYPCWDVGANRPASGLLPAPASAPYLHCIALEAPGDRCGPPWLACS